LVGKPHGRRPLGRPSRVWKGNIKVNLKETRCEDVGRIEMVNGSFQWRPAFYTAMSIRVP